MKGISIHIGVNNLNFVSPYGKLNSLKSCFFDAETMSRLMGANFEQPIILPDCTINQAKTHICNAQNELQNEGGIFVLTFSGHGVAIPDANGDERANGRFDSSWCLNDGFLLDDIIKTLLAGFAPAVKVVVVSDSCHSGTIIDFTRIGYTKEFIRFATAIGIDFRNLENKILREKGFDFIDFDEQKFQKDVDFLRQPKIENIRKKNQEKFQQKQIIKNDEKNISALSKYKNIVFPKNHKLDLANESLKFKSTFFVDNQIDKILDELKDAPFIENVKTLPRDLVKKIYLENSEKIKNERNKATTQLQKLADRENKSAIDFVNSRQILLLSACDDDEETAGSCSANENSYFVKAITEVFHDFPAGMGYKYLHGELKEKLFSYQKEISCKTRGFETFGQTPQLSGTVALTKQFLEKTKPFTI